MRLLRTGSFGRLAITSEALPLIVIVRYVVADDRILTTAQPGGRLSMGTAGTVVAFQADGALRGGCPTWTVSVTGVARRIVEPAERQTVDKALSDAGLTRDGAEAIAITTDVMTGRRLSRSSSDGGFSEDPLARRATPRPSRRQVPDAR